ncbi:hypothetical protein AB0M44_41515 [Streptosporangium subroseum]|uniref:hypothetical protein n=1 Tax=Streptosporangium subroseum TaxID=106412 RepID=UPI00341DA6ED
MAGFEINKRGIAKMQKEIAKEFERAARKHPIRVPVHTALSDVGVTPLRAQEAIEADPYQSRLLVWMDEQTQQGPGFVDVSRFFEEEELSTADARILVLRLEQRGLIKVSDSLAGRDFSQIRLIDEGVMEAQRVKALRNNRIAKFSHACDELLCWLFEAGRGQEAVEVMAFVEANGSYFAGESLTVDEIIGALGYLEKRGLASRIKTDGASHVSITAEVTEAGVDCALSRRTVNDFLSQQKASSDTYHISDSSGFVAGSQRSVIQHNSFGFDPSDLKQFADLVLQLAPVLGTSVEQQAEIIHEAEILSEETSSTEAEPGKIRAAYERLQTALGAVTTTSAGLTTLIEQGQQAYQAVFGG